MNPDNENDDSSQRGSENRNRFQRFIDERGGMQNRTSESIAERRKSILRSHSMGLNRGSSHFITPEGGLAGIYLRSVNLPTHCPCTSDNCYYDPRSNRVPSKPVGVRSAYFNLLRTTFGAGMLAMPLAISQMGIVVGPISVISMGMLLTYTHHNLLNSIAEVCRLLHVPYVPYRFAFRLALQHGPWPLHLISPLGAHIVSTIMLLSQLGICAVYLIFCADSVRDVFDLSSSGNALMYMFLPMIAIVQFMKSLTIISYLSILGNIFMISGLLFTTYELCSPPYYDEIDLYSNKAFHLFLAIGIFMFNLSAVAVVLAIDKSLDDPTHLTKPCGILNVGILTHSFVGAVFGLLGYVKFGEMDENVLRMLPFDNWSAFLIFTLYGTAIFLAYPIQSYPGIDLLMELYKVCVESQKTYCTLFTTEILMRILFVSLTFLMVKCVPFQAPLVAFVGSLCTSALAIIFPALMDLSLRHKQPSKPHRYLHLLKNVMLISLGVCICTFGVGIVGWLIYFRLKTKNTIPLAFVPPTSKAVFSYFVFEEVKYEF